MPQNPAALAKLTLPRTSGIVSRKRAFRLLDDRLRRGVVWISSPAGSGKTALAASYVETRALPWLWYRADGGDGDPATFFYYLGLAAKRAVPRLRTPLPLLTPEYLMGVPVFARRFFETLYRVLQPPFAIVMDDYQEIPADSPMHEILSIGLSIVPEDVRVIVASRNPPPAEFARLLANGGFSRLGWEEVRLTARETGEIVRARDRRRVPNEVVSLLHRKTDGWVAGLVLLIESLKSSGLDRGMLGRLPSREVYEYFSAEVFQKTDPTEQAFLLATSFLPSMTARTAGALTGVEAAGRILLGLNQRGFFTERHVASEPTYL